MYGKQNIPKICSSPVPLRHEKERTSKQKKIRKGYYFPKK